MFLREARSSSLRIRYVMTPRSLAIAALPAIFIGCSSGSSGTDPGSDAATAADTAGADSDVTTADDAAAGTDVATGDDAVGGDDTSAGADTTAGDDTGSGEDTTAGDDTGGGDDATTSGDASGGSEGVAAATAANTFLDSLSASLRAEAAYEYDDSEQKTCWSNLPGQARPGVTLGELTSDQRSAALALAATVLSDDGYSDLLGLLAADDYLGEQRSGGGGGGPGGLSYTSDNAHFAIFGEPGEGDWMLSIGNHHLAYNVTFAGSVVYPTPNHLGAEPRGEFTVGGQSYAPLVDDGDSFVALFAALSSTQVSSAHLSGTFADVVLGPVEYCTGSYSRVTFPTGSSGRGVLVSSLSTDQQALVTAAIEEWVRDYADFVSDDLMAAYTSAEAFGETYVAWGGSGSAPDVTRNGTYFRIDGPRVWIEVACQNGVVLSGTHYHTIYRDRLGDYGGAL